MAYDLALMGAGDIDDLLGDDMMGDDELLGDDVLLGQDALLGRRIRMARQNQSGNRGMMRQQPPPMMVRGAPPLLNRNPGVNPPSRQKLPLGFGVLTCANATPTASGGDLIARPQRPWRGEKLIVSVAGTNSGNYAVTFGAFIGVTPVLVSANYVDARSFPPNGLGNDLLCDAAQPGIEVSLRFDVTPGVGVGDTVIISATWICQAIA